MGLTDATEAAGGDAMDPSQPGAERAEIEALERAAARDRERSTLLSWVLTAVVCALAAGWGYAFTKIYLASK